MTDTIEGRSPEVQANYAARHKGENGSAQRQQDLIIHVNWDPRVPLMAWLKFCASVNTAVANQLEKLELKDGR